MALVMDHRTQVATLSFRYGKSRHHTLKEVPLFASEEIDIGRHDVQELFNVTDMTISSHHVRFWCNIFDEDDTSVCPAVYAHVISSTGSVKFDSSMSGSAQYLTYHDPARLLNDGDVLHLSRQLSVLYICPSIRTASAFNEHARRNISSSTDRYSIVDHVIGSGASASVVIAIRERDNRQLACKIIQRDDRQSRDEQARLRDMSLQREIEVLRTIAHPNIVRYEDSVTGPGKLYVLQELAAGGDLFSYMRMRDQLMESEIMMIAYQLTNAVAYLHQSGIVHRDIKPENILLTSRRPGTRIVLTDFGQARAFQVTAHGVRRTVRMDSIVGTAGWAAPELQREPCAYGTGIDVWALGCVTLSMFTREMPENSSAAFLSSQTLSQPPATVCSTTSQHNTGGPRAAGTCAQAFVRACLVLNQDERITAKAALHHAWFSDPSYAEDLVAAYQHAISQWKQDSHGAKMTQQIEEHYASPVSAAMSVDTRSDQDAQQHTESQSMVDPCNNQRYDWETQPTIILPLARESAISAQLSLTDFIPPPSAQMTGIVNGDAPRSMSDFCYTLQEMMKT